ncbi:MAG: adenine phosphoribosyltransferase [Anaerolineae bacterium]|nr:adenine phosphoribosyltransferase [Anaerolineae bacterium]
MEFVPLIRSIPDFPIPGILFRDITTLIKNGKAFREAVDALAELFADRQVDKVAGIEARGWIFGAPLAYNLGAGFITIRKPDKLPADKVRCEYALEYGTNVLEMHRDAIEPGDRVLLVDDLLATGGTARGSISMIEELGGEVVGVAFLIELKGLRGRDQLQGYDVRSVIAFEGA